MEDDDSSFKGDKDRMVVVERPIYNEFEFEQGFERSRHIEKTPRVWIQNQIHKFNCSCSCVGHFLLHIFPFVHLLRSYKFRRDLSGDIIAGLTVGIMHIPQGKDVFLKTGILNDNTQILSGPSLFVLSNFNGSFFKKFLLRI